MNKIYKQHSTKYAIANESKSKIITLNKIVRRSSVYVISELWFAEPGVGTSNTVVFTNTLVTIELFKEIKKINPIDIKLFMYGKEVGDLVEKQEILNNIKLVTIETIDKISIISDKKVNNLIKFEKLKLETKNKINTLSEYKLKKIHSLLNNKISQKEFNI